MSPFGYYMSPYAGTWTTSLRYLNCVDFFHDVVLERSVDGVKTNLGDVINNTVAAG